MKIEPFALERYFARYEFSAPYLLSCSDCEPLDMSELLSMAEKPSLQLWNKLKLAYTESQGNPALRYEISKLYNTINTDDIVVLVPEEGIFIGMNILLNPGDHVITTYPAYQSLFELAISLDCELSKWEPSDTGKFEIHDLVNQIKENTRLIIINFPHNPTGISITEKELQQIIEIARKREIFIFSDEMYRMLEYDEKDRLPSVSDLYHNSISLFGLSKSFALPGLRIGWLTTKNKKLIESIINFKDYTSICSSAPSEILAIIALQNKERIIKRNLEIIKKNLKIFENFTIRYSHLFKWKKPKAGTICFPELIIDESVDSFCQKLVDQSGIMLLPASVYHYQKKSVRIGFGRTNIPDILNRLENFLKTY